MRTLRRQGSTRRSSRTRACQMIGSPQDQTELNLVDANITSVIWGTGYKLDFSFVDMPLVDEWGYPKHTRGVTDIPGLVRRRTALG